MEFTSALQNGLDDHKPSLFGIALCVSHGSLGLTVFRAPFRATALRPHPPVPPLPSRPCHTPTTALPLARPELLRRALCSARFARRTPLPANLWWQLYREFLWPQA